LADKVQIDKAIQTVAQFMCDDPDKKKHPLLAMRQSYYDAVKIRN
jgi:hypothetical protein